MSKYEYYCSCRKTTVDDWAKNKHTKMHITTTEDSLCVYCKHYAIASQFRPKYYASPFFNDDIELDKANTLRKDRARRESRNEYA